MRRDFDSVGLLSPVGRQEAIAAMTQETLDVLVIGGGVTGVGIALDAACRGLSVGLVEAQDFAAGTSSRSSKLIHGGLRYLEMRDFRLVKEALGERNLLISVVAPGLVKPMPFLLPLRRKYVDRAYLGAGLALYDVMAWFSGWPRAVPRHSHLLKAGLGRHFPSLQSRSMTGAIRYFDGSVDDARFVISLARTARSFGAHLATGCRVKALAHRGPVVSGAAVEDLETGEEFRISARSVISAVGPWADDITQMAGLRTRAEAEVQVRASKGVHIVVPRSGIKGDAAIIDRTEKSVLFIIPQQNHWLIGTTDTDYQGPKIEPTAARSDVDYLLTKANQLLVKKLRFEDVVGVFAGIRPLVPSSADSSTKVSREHLVEVLRPGLVSVKGGKYTTYRVMAAEAVDKATQAVGINVRASHTNTVALIGAGDVSFLRAEFGVRPQLNSEMAQRWLERYGQCASDLADLVEAVPNLGDEIEGTGGYCGAEFIYAAEAEGARTLADILVRRTHVFVEVKDGGLGAALQIALLVAPILDWDQARVEVEVERYRELVVSVKGLLLDGSG